MSNITYKLKSSNISNKPTTFMFGNPDEEALEDISKYDFSVNLATGLILEGLSSECLYPLAVRIMRAAKFMLAEMPLSWAAAATYDREAAANELRDELANPLIANNELAVKRRIERENSQFATIGDIKRLLNEGFSHDMDHEIIEQTLTSSKPYTQTQEFFKVCLFTYDILQDIIRYGYLTADARSRVDSMYGSYHLQLFAYYGFDPATYKSPEIKANQLMALINKTYMFLKDLSSIDSSISSLSSVEILRPVVEYITGKIQRYIDTYGGQVDIEVIDIL